MATRETAIDLTESQVVDLTGDLIDLTGGEAVRAAMNGRSLKRKVPLEDLGLGSRQRSEERPLTRGRYFTRTVAMQACLNAGDRKQPLFNHSLDIDDEEAGVPWPVSQLLSDDIDPYASQNSLTAACTGHPSTPDDGAWRKRNLLLSQDSDDADGIGEV